MALVATLDFFIEEVLRLPIRKALDPNDPTDFAIISAQLAKATAGLAQADEAKALKAALAALDVDWKKMPADAKLKVITAAKAAVNPVKAVLPKVEEHFEANALKLGIQTKGAAKKTFGFSIAPDLTAVQVKSLQAVALSQGNYVRDEYGKRSAAFGLKAKQIVAEELAKGSSNKDIATRLHDDLSAQQFKRSQAYWTVVAGAFANRARTYTNLSSYEEAGITEFVIEAILDQRTSHVCRFMHGRRFTVAAGLGAMHRSEKPGADVKQEQPWMTTGSDADGNTTLKIRDPSGQASHTTIATVAESGMGKVDETGKFSNAMGNAGLEKLGIMTPPFHGNCRTTIVPHAAPGSTVQVPETFALAPTEAAPEAAPPQAAPAPLVAPEEQEGFSFGAGGVAPKPLEVLAPPPAPPPAFGPGTGAGPLKPVEVPALDPAAPPVVAVLPPKDKQQGAFEKFAALQEMQSADMYDLGAIPNPLPVKKSPVLGVGALGKPNDEATSEAIKFAQQKWQDGTPGSDVGVKLMPKKMGGLKSTDEIIDMAKVDFYINNPKELAKAVAGGEIVAAKIGKDVFIIKGHEAAAASFLLEKAEVKVLEINIATAKAKLKETAAAAAEELAAKKKPAVAVPIPPKPVPPPAPPPPPPPAPLGKPVDPSGIMAVKTGDAKGSNPGGFYTGDDGVKRYVKFYADPAQAHGEVLANALYGALGNPSPEAVTWAGKFEPPHPKAGQPAQMYAAKILDGKPMGEAGLDKAKARKFFDGFAADVLMGNWDAAGATCDNAFLTSKGGIARIDNGGAFLMRAQAGRKPAGALNVIGEIETFFPGGSPANPGYHKMAKAAGYSSVEDFKDSFKQQVADITALKNKHGSWSNFVSQYSPGLAGADRDAIVKMLETRHALLEQKVTELYTPKPPKPVGGTGAKNTAPSDAKNTGYREPPIAGVPPAKGLKVADLPEVKGPGGVVADRREPPRRMPEGCTRDEYADTANKAVAKIAPKEKAAVKGFTNGTYGEIRDSEERGKPNAEAIQLAKMFDNGIAHPGTTYRGIRGIPVSVAETWMRHTDADGPFRLGRNNTGASSSTAWHADVAAHSFMGGLSDPSEGTVKVFFKIHHRSGVPIETISSCGRGETEVLLPPDAEFRVKQVAKWEGKKRIVIIELEEI